MIMVQEHVIMYILKVQATHQFTTKKQKIILWLNHVNIIIIRHYITLREKDSVVIRVQSTVLVVLEYLCKWHLDITQKVVMVLQIVPERQKPSAQLDFFVKKGRSINVRQEDMVIHVA